MKRSFRCTIMEDAEHGLVAHKRSNARFIEEPEPAFNAHQVRHRAWRHVMITSQRDHRVTGTSILSCLQFFKQFGFHISYPFSIPVVALSRMSSQQSCECLACASDQNQTETLFECACPLLTKDLGFAMKFSTNYS